MTTRSPFGVEFATFKAGQEPDLDPSFRQIAGEPTIVQAVLRSWLTPFDTAAEGEGRDLRSFAQMRLSSTNRALCRRQLKAQAERDERVKSCDVKADPFGDALRIRARITPREGKPFELVVDATELTAKLVSFQLLAA